MDPQNKSIRILSLKHLFFISVIHLVCETNSSWTKWGFGHSELIKIVDSVVVRVSIEFILQTITVCTPYSPIQTTLPSTVDMKSWPLAAIMPSKTGITSRIVSLSLVPSLADTAYRMLPSLPE